MLPEITFQEAHLILLLPSLKPPNDLGHSSPSPCFSIPHPSWAPDCCTCSVAAVWDLHSTFVHLWTSAQFKDKINFTLSLKQSLVITLSGGFFIPSLYLVPISTSAFISVYWCVNVSTFLTPLQVPWENSSPMIPSHWLSTRHEINAWSW